MARKTTYKRTFLVHFNSTILTNDPYNNVGKNVVDVAEASQQFHNMHWLEKQLEAYSREYKCPYPFHATLAQRQAN